MTKIKRIIWTIYMLLFCRPYSLKQFKIFCLKIDGTTKEEWEQMEFEIRSDKTLSNFFKIK